MKTLKIILTKVAFCGDAATMESSTKECSGETCHQNDRCPIKSALIRYYHQNRNIAKQFANLTNVFCLFQEAMSAVVYSENTLRCKNFS